MTATYVERVPVTAALAADRTVAEFYVTDRLLRRARRDGVTLGEVQVSWEQYRPAVEIPDDLPAGTWFLTATARAMPPAC